MKLWKDLDDNVNKEEEEATKVVCPSRLPSLWHASRVHATTLPVQTPKSMATTAGDRLVKIVRECRCVAVRDLLG